MVVNLKHAQRKTPLVGGAIGLKGNSIANAPPKKKKKENPLKKELSNPQGLDFANQAGALMAQPQKVEMLPPNDITEESTRPEKATSGVKNESKKVLRTKANVFAPPCKGEEASHSSMKVHTQDFMRQRWSIQ